MVVLDCIFLYIYILLLGRIFAENGWVTNYEHKTSNIIPKAEEMWDVKEIDGSYLSRNTPKA